ncbi:protocatechuate 3,4-dioxygenase subunit alpha [Jannaschia pohangensis]|uniref:Protocatechuate 3,4-dioxygenase, alpha subunit n=1 Tax=Jannaschia pohangensis TaxID=390807 RepID=A0A1I3HEA0_9RHOB|nr:protocatechuate 3,4-dioxygenase subunit alpha [Jannaschia pohangensis]SFI33900.1 protocatechuate 3,4-dioxygenase, alpha subunit [Jannaschia pohangensis]
MAERSDRLRETPSQTAGPYVHIGLAPTAAGIDGALADLGREIAGDAQGARITVSGRVIDGKGAPVADALIEVWQADAAGRYGAEGFRGWGRVIPDFETGEWRFDTIRPGSTGPGIAPHLTLWIVARGINIGLHTRLYFGDEGAANDADPVLALVPDGRRGTLIAAPDGPDAYRFDIHLQGEDETVFFDA